MRSFMTALITGTLVFTLTSLAYAGPRIVTPRLFPLTDGRLKCTVVNASATRSLEVRITIYNFLGAVSFGPQFASILPNRSTVLSTSNDNARHCVVEVLKGGKRNARVVLVAADSNSNPLVAVSGE